MNRWLAILFLFILCLGAGSHATPPSYVPAYGPQYASSDDLLKQILEELRALRKDVQSLKQGSGGQQAGALGIIGNRCLHCHQDGKAADSGGDFVMVEKEGALAEFSVAEKRRIVREVKNGHMPKDATLPEAEKKILIEYFSPKEEQKK